MSIKQHEKTVNIRFGNYSMLMRAAQYGISSKLLALLGGMNALSAIGGNTTKNNKDLIDAAEEKLLNDKDKESNKAAGSSWD